MNLTADEQQMVDLVAEFVDERVRPRVRDFEQDDIYPAEFIEEMKALGFFGLLAPPNTVVWTSARRASRASPRNWPAAG